MFHQDSFIQKSGWDVVDSYKFRGRFEFKLLRLLHFHDVSWEQPRKRESYQAKRPNTSVRYSAVGLQRNNRIQLLKTPLIVLLQLIVLIKQNSPTLKEYKTQSAKVLTLSWEWARQVDHNDTL